MNRRDIPLIGMIESGQEELRREGVVSMRFRESLSKDPSRLTPHYHHFFQVSLFCGSGWLMHDFRETRIGSDAVFFLSPGQVHTMHPDDGTDGTVISFTREFFGEEAAMLFDLPFFYATHRQPWIGLDPAQSPSFRELFREVQSEYDRAETGANEVIRSLLRILFVRASRLYNTAETSGSGQRGNKLVRDFHQSVELHFRDWQTLEPYARALAISVNHLNDVIRETTGKSAGEHIRARRLLDAKRLLLHSEWSVSEIGYHLGFRDPSYFSRFFRRYEMATPAEFRSAIREEYQKPGQ